MNIDDDIASSISNKKMLSELKLNLESLKKDNDLDKF